MARDYIEQREGNFYVAGTRVSLASIVQGFRQAKSAEEIQQTFPVLTLEEVYGAIAYYLANQTEVEVYLSRQASAWSEGRSTSAELPSELRDKIARARQEIRTPRAS